MPNASWKVWIDTGGTFTDCVALDPEGRLHQAKVLSSSALRGTVEEVLPHERPSTRHGSPDAMGRGQRATSLRVDLPSGVPSGLLEGFHFRLLGSPNVEAVVTSHDSDIVTLDGDARVAAGDSFEAQSPEEAPILAARMVSGTPSADPLPPMAMRLATTRGTNALLERRGADIALFVTEGFGDLLSIGTQQRPDLFALNILKPPPFPEHTVEVSERLAADGTIVRPLDLERLETQARTLTDNGIRHAAVSFMHGYRNPQHERELARALSDLGFEHVSCSSDIAPFIQYLTRTETTVVEAYLHPIVGEYLKRVHESLCGGSLHVMTSAGGLTEASTFRAKDCLLSGPAGGVVGAALAGHQSGCERLIAFDMGGTSTDVSRFDGDFEYVFESKVGDAHLVAPSLDIETVAAGGGSVCTTQHGLLRVGPESAGAHPGPACYGAGGPLTLTDVNLLLGRLQTKRFEIPISVPQARSAFREVRDALERQRGHEGSGGSLTGDSDEALQGDSGGSLQRDPDDSPLRDSDEILLRDTDESLLEGLLEIANERMADAIRRVSLRRGYDPKDHALVAFGGAGGQHACAVARKLGMDRVVVPHRAGLLSALGLGHARMERFAERQVLRSLKDGEGDLQELLDVLAREATDQVAAEGVSEDCIEIRRRIARVRFHGQDSVLDVEVDDPTSLRADFLRQYEQVFGHRPEVRQVELESLRVVASSHSEDVAPESADGRGEESEGNSGEAKPNEERTDRKRAGPVGYVKRDAVPDGESNAFFSGWRKVPTYRRDGLPERCVIEGPALVFDPHSAVVVERDWKGEIDGARALVLTRKTVSSPHPGRCRIPPASAPRPEAVQVQLFAHRFTHLALEMGEQLRRTAISTNIKERLDFSCALLDPQGRLVVNAPHIPVHLGSLGLCVRSLRDAVSMNPGDVVVTNHPSFGGSHLPDITVVTPVFLEGTLLGYVSSRAHHAELGGLAPGSMPAAAKVLAEEGAVIPPTYLVRGGTPDWDEMRDLLTGDPYPTRALDDNLADLCAAVAANQRGVESLRTLAQVHGARSIAHYMEALERHAEDRMRAALSGLDNGCYEALEHLDDGSAIAVSVSIQGDSAEIDFNGSADVHPGNLNATEAVVRATVMYVLRLLVDEPLPLNEGLMRAVILKVPEGMLNPSFEGPPEACPAIVGGNVETSQRIVDTLLRALGLAACSQGTMNNISFGDDSFGYYETVCGGSGAGPGFHGASAVHTHMTNTRITDPEILEHRYPVRMERFAVRRGSGGRGRWHGGDGVIREILFLKPMTMSLLSQHRREGPYGLERGGPGRPGRQVLIRSDGETRQLRGIDGVQVSSGDRLLMKTPGGGGYGR